MNRFLTKIVSMSLALIVLFATTSFTVSIHYCCDVIVDTSIFSQAESCTLKIPDSRPEICTMNENSCCKDMEIIKRGQDDLQRNDLSVNFETFELSFPLIYPQVNLFKGLEKNIVPFREYSPPLLYKDFALLYETFLI